MLQLVCMRKACVALIVAIGIASPAAGDDRPIILKNPVTPTIVRPKGLTHKAPEINRPTQAGQQPVKVEIKACKLPRDCPSGECWDGICCNATCRGKCVSCAMPGHEGICTPVPDGQDPRRACTIVQGGHPACNTACYSGQCMFPDVGKPCGICSQCNGTGRCTIMPTDDNLCGVLDCNGLDSPCRKYQDLRANRCASLGVCKTANDPATCTQYTNHYSSVDANDVRRECATGKIMNCYKRDTRWMWQDGSVIKDCYTGKVCVGCAPPTPKKPEDWVPPKGSRPGPGN